ncbi:mediator of RNA polymerase II transcription subunit 14 [Podospora fimiseda]|uniref:Mediator of RNA polymerase II transcription subunit 14 n=1 Tax=Podospora fimiseda TaxID=252190 RepID=A0AAN7H191_9PEZI|nr:mediator of RNA polymerase II transcription subunit 14 [Podospora fimiseda]
MAGEVRMENGTHIGVRNNHDRDTWINGVSRVDKGKGIAQPQAVELPLVQKDEVKEEPIPDELEHITADMVPIDLFLTRLAQYSHSTLQEQILALGSKPLPQNLPNGNTLHFTGGPEDTSPESLDKKTMLLDYLQTLHTKWVKALVIIEWSKKADQVARLIDIRWHLFQKLELFNNAFAGLMNLNIELQAAKVPSPDLKTAVQVLSDGEVSWMPDFGYIVPPRLTLEEQATWIDHVNTLLNARLTLEECEKIPEPFTNYTVDSGRVTFAVTGEFEVDLTILDEDFTNQFLCLDFRFLFKPAPQMLSLPAQEHLHVRINEKLAVEGLAGCYSWLHEVTLTAKITEFARQAWRLSTEKWTGGLKIERLDRGLSIQYWVHRPHSKGSRSWIILGVNSAGKDSDGGRDPLQPSHLTLRWFRDNQEVKDCDIVFDTDNISVEKLLTSVIARHVEHMLSYIYHKLARKPRFAQNHARLSLEISEDSPRDTALTVQLLGDDSVSLHIDQYMGAFSISPPVPLAMRAQNMLNSFPNAVDQAPHALEKLRWDHMRNTLISRGFTLDWHIAPPPITSQDELKGIVGSTSRESFQVNWLWKRGWTKEWFVLMSMSLGGDSWWLVETSEPAKTTIQNRAEQNNLAKTKAPTPNRVSMFTKIPMSSDQLRLSDKFFENLTLFASGMISRIADLRLLHHKRIDYNIRECLSYGGTTQVKMPILNVRLSALTSPTTNPHAVSWAQEYVSIVFKGLQSSRTVKLPTEPGQASEEDDEGPDKVIAEARIAVKNHSSFQFLKGNIDQNILYDPKSGTFTVRFRREVGSPLFTILSDEILDLERLLDLVQAIHRAGECVALESVTLRQVVFTYGSKPLQGAQGAQDATAEPPKRWRVTWNHSPSHGVTVNLEQGNPHLRVIDFIQKMAKSPSKGQIPTWLVNTLPLYRALEKLNNAWENFETQRFCLIFHKALNWVTIRFCLPTGVGQPRRVVNLDIKPQTRRGRLMWHVGRAETDRDSRNENDEFNIILRQRVWTAKGDDGYTGLVNSAAANLDHGIENCIAQIDRAIRSLPTKTLPPVGGPQDANAAAGTQDGVAQYQNPPGRFPPQGQLQVQHRPQQHQQGQGHMGMGGQQQQQGQGHMGMGGQQLQQGQGYMGMGGQQHPHAGGGVSG